MAKIIGDINWIPQPEYPKLSGEENNIQLTAKFVTSVTSLPENLPDYGSTYYDERWPFFNSFSYLVLSSRSVEVMLGAKTVEITLTYAIPQLTELDGDTKVMQEIEYQSVELDVPIEQHPNYLTNWNYRLLAKGGITQSPSWWTTKKNTQLTEEEIKQWQWIKPGEQIPDGWYELYPEQKPGVEAYKTYVPEIHVRKMSNHKKALQRVAALDGTKQTPPDTFGRGGEWLQSCSSLKKEGGYWVLTVRYLNSKTIDTEIYPNL